MCRKARESVQNGPNDTRSRRLAWAERRDARSESLDATAGYFHIVFIYAQKITWTRISTSAPRDIAE